MARQRLHKSSIVIGLWVAALLVLIIIPGRVVDWHPHWFTTFEHGWPFIYLRRETVQPPPPFGDPVIYSFRRDALSQLPMWGIPWLRAANWRIWKANVEDGVPRWDFNGLILFADCAIALAVLVAIAAGWEFRRRRRSGLFRFSLADMLVAVAVLSAALGWLVQFQRQFDQETLLTEFEVDTAWSVSDEVCIAPIWFRSLIGERFFPTFLWRADAVMVEPELVDDANDLASEISQLAYLRKIELMQREIKPFEFSALRAVKQLETLELGENSIDGQDVNELTQLTGLQKIVFEDKDEIAPEILSRLEAKLPSCKIVDFYEDW